MDGHVSHHDLVEALWVWDPIGIAEHRTEVASEYDALAAKMMARIDSGATADDVAILGRRFVSDLGILGTGVLDFERWLRASMR